MIVFEIGLAIIAIVIIVSLFLMFVAEPLEVVGNSMNPTLNNEDIILILKTNKNYQRGDIVALIPPVVANGDVNTDSLAVKRIKKISSIPHVESKRIIMKTCYWVEGDNAEVSFDSRNYGWVSPSTIEGRVIKVWKRRK